MYAVITINVLTESGARYTLRQHKERLYVTRMGEGHFDIVNKVTTRPVQVIAVGVPMRVDFSDGGFVRTSPIAAVDYRVDRYLAS